METLSSISFRQFTPDDQAAVNKLILNGLVEHWGWLDETKNPDLQDIAVSYREAVFLVGWAEGLVIACGALKKHSHDIGEIVRMSVAAPYRRQGVGRRMLEQLIAHASQQGCRTVILETTAAWKDVVAFYLKHGFRITHYEGEDVYFELVIDPLQKSSN